MVSNGVIFRGLNAPPAANAMDEAALATLSGTRTTRYTS